MNSCIEFLDKGQLWMLGEVWEKLLKHFIAELFLAQDEVDKEACRKSAVALGVLGGINNEDFLGSELPYFFQEGPGK